MNSERSIPYYWRRGFDALHLLKIRPKINVPGLSALQLVEPPLEAG